jgi:hypothetical protein
MTAPRLVRFAAVLVVLAGYLLVFRAGERRIGERVEENARIVERIGAAERTLASARALEGERARLRAGLHAVELGADRSALVARFVRDAARIAAARHTTIATIAAAGTTSRPAAGIANAAVSSVAALPNPADSFETIPLEVVVEGRYTDVLATVRALSRAPVLAGVEIASLTRKNADAADTALTAALHVVLQRLSATETAGVRTRPG